MNVMEIAMGERMRVLFLCTGHACRSQTSVVHFGFDVPPRLAKDARTEDEAVGHYRRVRDEIRAWVERIETVLPPPLEVTCGVTP